jgi:A/G-specific adenine glycosylase
MTATGSTAERRLRSWQATARRELPWRRTKDPWAILVSEVMLQQTQVSRVMARWTEWMRRWPSPKAIAAEDRLEVLRTWKGLGYNRRAINLHRAAALIAQHGWPEDLTQLPGVGRYTADAVARFAFGAPVMPHDTNIRRVLERTGASFSPASAEAVMDLGATICIARLPKCDECPLRELCPSRGKRFEPLRRQGRFEGSFRQRRAQTLWAVLDGAEDPHAREPEVMASLRRDGLL